MRKMYYNLYKATAITKEQNSIVTKSKTNEIDSNSQSVQFGSITIHVVDLHIIKILTEPLGLYKPTKVIQYNNVYTRNQRCIEKMN